MFNYGFNNFGKVEVPGGYVTIPNGKDVAGLKVVETVSGDVTAEAYYYNDDYFVGTGIKEESTQDFEEIQEIIPAEEPETTKQQGVSKENEQDLKQTYRYIIYILGGLIGIALLISVISAIIKHK